MSRVRRWPPSSSGRCAASPPSAPNRLGPRVWASQAEWGPPGAAELDDALRKRTMTTQETIVELNGLIQTCKDGELGYTTAASDVGNTELETVFSEYAAERRQFARNLQSEVERLGGNPEGSGSTSGTLLRGWM